MCIRLIEPDEKLLITVPQTVTPDQMTHIVNMVNNFRESGNILVLKGNVYLVKDGEQILLEDEVEGVTQ